MSDRKVRRMSPSELSARFSAEKFDVALAQYETPYMKAALADGVANGVFIAFGMNSWDGGNA